MAKNTETLERNTDQILQGIRIVLPGTQALMGFQFIAFSPETATAVALAVFVLGFSLWYIYALAKRSLNH